MATYGVFGGWSVFDDTETVRVATPWAPSLVDQDSYPVSGGGGYVGGKMVVWRGRGQRLWIAEAGISRTVPRVAVVDLPSVLGSVEVIADVWICVSTEVDLICMRFEEDLGRLAECHRVEISAVWSGDASLPRAWASPTVCWMGSSDGGVVRIDVVQRRCRYFDESTFGSRLVRGFLSPGSASRPAVSAIACAEGACLVGKRDGSLALWKDGRLAWTANLPDSDTVTAVALSVDLAAAAAAAKDQITLFTAESGAVKAVLSAEKTPVQLCLTSKAIWARSDDGILTWAPLDDDDSTAMSLVGGRQSERTTRFERAVAKRGWANALGCDDWPGASAMIEREFLERLGQPGRYGARALSDALTRSLPDVLRRNDATANDALAAARNWFVIGAKDWTSFDEKCTGYYECWRRLDRLIDDRATSLRTPVGFFLSKDEDVPPVVVQASGGLAFVAALHNNTENDDDDDDFFAIRAPALADQIRSKDDVVVAIDDAIFNDVEDDSSDLFHDPITARILDMARNVAAGDIALALECVKIVRGESLEVVASAAALLGPPGPWRTTEDRILSATAANAAVAGAAAAARSAYEKVRAGILIWAVAVSLENKQHPIAELVAIAKALRLVEAILSTAPLRGSEWPASRSLVEDLALVSTTATFYDGRGMLEALVTVDDLLRPGGLAAKLLARSPATNANLIAVLASRPLWRPYATKLADAAVDEARLFGDSIANLLAQQWVSTTPDVFTTRANRLQEAAHCRPLEASNRAWFAAVAHGSAEMEALGTDLFFSADDHKTRKGRARIARYILDHGVLDDQAKKKLEAAIFDVDIASNDVASAFAKTTRDPAFGPRLNVSDDRLATFVQTTCESGGLGTLCGLPWGKEERKKVDEILNRLARESNVDYYGCLYAFRARRHAWDDAAKGALELASRADHTSSAADLWDGRSQATVALGAQVAALNALHLLRPEDAFVTARAPVVQGSTQSTELQLTSRDDLEVAVCIRTARLQLAAHLGDDRSVAPFSAAPRDVASALARRNAHDLALDLVKAQGSNEFSHIIASLAKRCVDLDDDPSAALDSRDDRSPFADAPVPGRQSSFVFGPRSRRAWRLLRTLIEGCDSRSINFACSKAAAHAVLAAGRELPRWLVDRFGTGFATGSGDPAALLRLYVRYDLDSALHLAADLLETHHLDSWLPYSHLEALLQASDGAGSYAKTRFLTSLNRYAGDLVHATLLEKATDTGFQAPRFRF